MRFCKASPGEILVCRLEHKSDLLDSLKDFAAERGVSSGFFFMIGAVARARFSYYDQAGRKYVEETVDKPMEVLSCVGNVAKFKGDTVVHAHIVVSDYEGKLRGGHLVSGTEVFAGEVFLVRLEEAVLEREYDEVTGLNQFRV